MHASSKQIMSKMRKQVSSIEILEIDKQELTRLQNNKLDEIEQLNARLKAFEDSNEDLSKKSFEYDLILPQFEELSVNATTQLLRIDELREEERKLKEDVRKATAKIEELGRHSIEQNSQIEQLKLDKITLEQVFDSPEKLVQMDKEKLAALRAALSALD